MYNVRCNSPKTIRFHGQTKLKFHLRVGTRFKSLSIGRHLYVIVFFTIRSFVSEGGKSSRTNFSSTNTSIFFLVLSLFPRTWLILFLGYHIRAVASSRSLIFHGYTVLP